MISIPTASANGYPGPDYACVCDHWAEYQVNTVYDEYTGSGINATYGSPGHYNWANITHDAGYGGWYTPKPNSQITCIDVYGWVPTNTYSTNTWSYTPTWYYPRYPFGGTFAYYESIIFSVITPGPPTDYFKAQTQGYFQNQTDTSKYWLCGSQFAIVP